MAEKKIPQTEPGDKGTPQDEPKFFGKYKTKKEAEQAYKELEHKLGEQGAELGAARKALEEEKKRIKQIEDAKAEEEKKVTEEEYKAMSKEFVENMRKDPMGTLDRYIRSHPSVANRVTIQDLKRKEEQEKKNREAYEKFREAHKEDFDKLKSKMAEIWGKLPLENRKPEMLEIVYKAAKAESLPDEAKLREKIIEDMKAGHSEGGSETPPEKKEKDEADKATDEIIEAYKGSKVI